MSRKAKSEPQLPNFNVDPPKHAALCTPSDEDDLEFVARAISFATAGTIKVTYLGGRTVILPSGTLAPGMMHSGFITKVWEEDTTATGIVVYW